MTLSAGRSQTVAWVVVQIVLFAPILWLVIWNAAALGSGYLYPSSTCWISKDEKFLFPAEGAAILLLFGSFVWGPIWVTVLGFSLWRRWIGVRTIAVLTVCTGISIRWMMLEIDWLNRLYGDFWRAACV